MDRLLDRRFKDRIVMQVPNKSNSLSRSASRSVSRRNSRSPSPPSQPLKFWSQLLYAMRPPAQLSAGIGDAIAWLGLAIVVRLLADYGLTLWPSLWPLILGSLVAPALIAIWLSRLFPQLSPILGYRSLLLMFGLLLGGRL